MCTPQCIIDKLGGLAFDEAVKPGKYVLHYAKNLKNLQDAMRKLDDRKECIHIQVCEAIDGGQEIMPDVKTWQTEADSLKNDVDQLMEESTTKGNMHCIACSCPNIKWRYQLSRQAEKKIQDVKELTEKGHFEEIAHRKPPPPELESLSSENYVKLDSRKPIFNKIVHALEESSVNMIGVYGPGGVGKTTLVLEVAEKMRRDGTFKQVSRATIPKGLTLEEIQSQLADGLNFKFDTDKMGSRAIQLWNKLTNGEKYLIILDDIWEKLDIKALGIPITDVNKNCKVLLTSRDKDLLLIKMKVDSFAVAELPEAEAWDLFKKKVGNSFESYREIDSIAHAVCKRCQGLPVAINAIGAALEGKSVYAWKDALVKLERYELMDIEGIDTSVWASLRLSYDLLSSNAKSCFLLCCLFREDAEIPIGDLTRHCLARRLLSRNPRTLEEVRNSVCTVIDALKSASLLLDSASLLLDRHKNFVRIHDIIRDVGIAIAREEKAFYVEHGALHWPENPIDGPPYSAISLISARIEALPTKLICPKLHTLMFENNKLLDLEIPDEFFSEMTQLSVLILTGMRMQQLPSSFGKLAKLRMLFLIECHLADISILGDLNKELEVLRLRGSIIKALSPISGQLTSLQVLDLEKCKLKYLFSPTTARGLVHLEQLQVSSCEIMEGIVGFEGDGNEHVGEVKFAKLKQLKLENLPNLISFYAKKEKTRTTMGSSSTNAQPLFNETVAFPGLENLYLEGLQNVSDIWCSELPPSSFFELKKLKVINCACLRNIFHPSMANGLVNLKELLIEDCSTLEAVIGKEEEVGGQGRKIDKILFPRLGELQLDSLPNLRRFCNSTHLLELPQLSKMDIFFCPSMDAFSLGHASAPSLSLPDISWNGDLNNAVQSLGKMSTTAPEGAPQSQQQVPPTPLESQQPSTKKMSTIAIEGASQSQQQVPPAPLKSQQPSTMGSFLEIVEMSTTTTEGAPQSQHQVLPTPLESEQPSTMKMPTPATEGAPQSQQRVPPTPLESQHPSTMTMPTTAIEGASQSQQQVPPTPLDSQHPSTMRMSTTAPEGAPQSQQQVPPTPLEPQQPSTKKMSTIAIEGASQSQQQVPPTPLKSQQPSTMGSFLEIVEMPTSATEGAPQSQQQVPPAPLESQHPSTMTMPTAATEGASQSQQQVPPTPFVSQHPSPMKMPPTAPEGAPQMKDIILRKIKDYVVSPIGRQFTYMFDFNNNIDKLEIELAELQRTRDLLQSWVVESRAQVQIIEPNVEAWLTRAIEVTNHVEGIITDKAKVKEGCLNGFCPNIKLRYSLSRKAMKNTKVVVDLEAAGFDYVKSAYCMPQVENFRALKSQRLNMEEISEENLKALKSQMLYLEEIIKALEHDQIDLIGICGMAGVGKTTMAKEVAKRAKKNKLFDEVAMAVVGQNPNLSKVQASIAGMLGLELGEPENLIVTATLLRQRLLLDNKKILVILDDTWVEVDLLTIGIPLGGTNKNVKILYTSRVQDLWCDLQTKKEIHLELLSDDEAWQLFREKAGDLADDQDFQPLAKQIMNECGRLPIALVLIGRTLFKKSRGIFIKDMWEKILNELIRSRSTPAEKHLSPSVELSYNYIEDEEARRLFLLCCFVEEEKSIHSENLVRYGWGLSLFPRVNTMRKVRHQVSALVDDLKGRYLLLDSENDKCVEVHDVVRDMGISIASKDKGVLVCHGAVSEWPKEETYEHYTSLSVISDRITELPERWAWPNLEFLLLECCKVEKLPSNFFEGMEKLKVLGLNNFDGILTLQSLRNLRTLSLKRFGGVLDNVSVMGGLVNLEILNFHGSSIKELPEEIGDLLNLRLLDLGDTWSLDKVPAGIISRLVRLEELYIFNSKFREWEGDGEEEEGRNANLREFESLLNLNTLEICIRCDVLIPEVPIFTQLTTYKVLIGDTGGRFRHIDQYKTKLIVSASSPIPSNRGWFDLLLRSTDCLILEGEGCKDMVRELLLRDGVDGLQQLKYLQISHCDTPECLANAMNLVQLPTEPTPAVFPILEKLKLSTLPNLREICRGPAPAGSFGKLTDIDIDNCGRLGHLFQLTIVRSLTQLKSLSIMRCDTMEEVIWEEQREDVLVATSVIDFPKLETLVLDNLPSLVGFGREINGIDFPHAKCLRLRHLRHLQCLFANNHGFLSLFPQKVTFPSLELLELQGLQNLGDVWGSELLDLSFSKLKELEVEDCGSLIDLFHPSMAGGLVNLQKLVVKNCQKMNAVVGREKEIEYGHGRAIEKTLFPQLIVLELHCLPNLRRFCYFTHPIESELRRIYISDCPSMDAFSLGNVSTPNLSLPGVPWNGNLNNAIQLLQEMSTAAPDGTPQSQPQVPPTPLESQQPSTMKISKSTTEGALQSQQQVPPTLLESQQPSTTKMPTAATEGVPQSQQQVPPTPLESQQLSTIKENAVDPKA